MNDHAIPTPLHFSCFWNLQGTWNPQAPEGMRIWAEILRKFKDFPPDHQYAWYGKISIGDLGIPNDIVPDLNSRIQEQNKQGIETRLYLYTYYELMTSDKTKSMKVPYSLHVAKVLELRGQEVYEDEEERKHIPLEFYEKIRAAMFGEGEGQRRWNHGDAIPFFFKISDIRELNIAEAARLEEATVATNYHFQPFEWHVRISPAYVRERPLRYEPLFGGPTRWWEEVLNTAEDLDPGKFRTAAVQRVYYQALQYAGINRPVLIVGERGTGKSRLARFIRRNSSYFKEGSRYSDNWPLISCGDFDSHADAEREIFDNEERLTGETLVLEDIEYLPHTLTRKILSRYESAVKASSVGNKSKDFRIIACTSLRPYEIYDRLDARFLDACAAVLELPSLFDYTDEDKKTAWLFQYNMVKKRLLGDEPVRALGDEECGVLEKVILRHRLPGNYRDLQRLATRIILELRAGKISGLQGPMTADELLDIIRAALPEITSNPASSRDEAAAIAWAVLSDRFECIPKKDFDHLLDRFNSWARYGWASCIKNLKEIGHPKAEDIFLSKSDREAVWRYVSKEGPHKRDRATETSDQTAESRTKSDDPDRRRPSDEEATDQG
ncbi:MAG: sigma 54-interacting transcriptional regulator [Pseudomonadota bacterium]